MIQACCSRAGGLLRPCPELSLSLLLAVHGGLEGPSVPVYFKGVGIQMSNASSKVVTVDSRQHVYSPTGKNPEAALRCGLLF